MEIIYLKVLKKNYHQTRKLKKIANSIITTLLPSIMVPIIIVLTMNLDFINITWHGLNFVYRLILLIIKEF